MKVIVCHEMSKKPLKSANLANGMKFSEWLSPQSGTTQTIGLRMIGHENFGQLAKTRVRVLSPTVPKTAKVSGAELLEAIHVFRPNKISLLVLVYEVSKNKLEIVDKLRRPGIETNSRIFHSLGLSADVTTNIYSTCISLDSIPIRGEDAFDGWLKVETRNRSEFLDEVTYRLVALMIAVERYLINNASKYLSKRILFLGRILLIRDQLLRWPPLPPIDSTLLANRYLSLRESLALDARRKYVMDALNARAKRQETLLSVLGLFSGGVAIVVTILLSRQ